MSLAFLALAIGLLLLPGAAVRVSRRINGHTWLRVTAGSLIAGIVFLEAGLLLAAVPTVFRWLGVTGLADLCQRVAGHLVPGGAAAGAVAAGGSVALPTLLAVSAIRARTRSRRLWHVAGTMGHIQPRDPGREVVTIADPTPFAISVPGRPGRIIITEGLRDLLDDDELEGVIRHEIAHLDERHSILTTFAAGLRGSLRWFRPARRSVAALHLGMERCADSKASAGRSDLRASVRNALLKVAAHPQPTRWDGLRLRRPRRRTPRRSQPPAP